MKEKQNRMGDSNLPKVTEEEALKLVFPRHLGESRASSRHIVARKMLLPGSGTSNVAPGVGEPMELTWGCSTVPGVLLILMS